MTIREDRPVQGREVVIERPDGGRSHVQPHPQLLRDDSGAVVGAVNMLVDITGRHRADAALGTSEEKFAKVVHNSPHPILAMRVADGRIIEVNNAFAQFFGLTREEALALFTEKPAQFDLVVTDLNMPGLSGTEFARRLLALRPDVRIILTTGYSATITADVARELGFRALLPKPCDLRSLGETVQRVVTEPAHPRPA